MSTAVTAISAARLATIMAGVQERVEEQRISESERLKRINDEKAAKKATLQVRIAIRRFPVRRLHKIILRIIIRTDGHSLVSDRQTRPPHGGAS